MKLKQENEVGRERNRNEEERRRREGRWVVKEKGGGNGRWHGVYHPD